MISEATLFLDYDNIAPISSLGMKDYAELEKMYEVEEKAEGNIRGREKRKEEGRSERRRKMKEEYGVEED